MGRKGGHSLSWLSDWGVWRRTPLESVGDNHSPDPMYVWQWDHAHLVLLGLVGGRQAWRGVWWCLAPTWQGECLLHYAYMLAIFKVGWRMVVSGAHLARRVLAALGVCVGYMCWLYVK